MATRSLNKVQLIGNLTRDPELRYTPQGTAVCTFGVATNRTWTTDTGEKKEDAEFHNIVVWTRLAEICAEYLSKGRQVYIEGRLSTREWETQEGEKRRTTEIVANEVIFLGGGGGGLDVPAELGEEPKQEPKAKSEAKEEQADKEAKAGEKKEDSEKKAENSKKEEEAKEEDIPF